MMWKNLLKRKHKKFDELSDKEKLVYLKMQNDEPSIIHYYQVFFQIILLFAVVALAMTNYRLDALYTSLNLTYIPSQKVMDMQTTWLNVFTVLIALMLLYAAFFIYDCWKWGRKYKAFKKSIKLKK